MNIIILADKYQKRMKSKGCVGLFEHKKTPFYLHQYIQFKNLFPKCKIVYIYGFDNKKLEASLEVNKKSLKKDIKFVYNKDYETYNDGASLFLTLDFLNDDVLIYMGEYVVNNLILSKLKINENYSQIVTSKNNNPLGCIITNHKIENVFFDLDNKIENFYYLKKEDSIKLAHILKNQAKTKNMFVFELINQMIENNVTFKPLYYNKIKICTIKR